MTKVMATRSALVIHLDADGNPTTSQVVVGDVIDMGLPEGASVPDGFVAANQIAQAKTKAKAKVEETAEVPAEETGGPAEVSDEEKDEREGER